MAVRATLKFDHQDIIRLIEEEANRRIPDLGVDTVYIHIDKNWETKPGEVAVSVLIEMSDS